jgi:hypothetical protein
MESIILGAGKIISQLSCLVNVGATKVLTTVTTVLLPPNTSEKGSDVSIRDLCEMPHINRISTYAKKGIENRKQHDFCLLFEGDIAVSKTVSFRSSPEVLITKIGRNEPVTVWLLPFKTEKLFLSFLSDEIRHYEASLYDYFCTTLFNTAPTHVKTTTKECSIATYQ